MTNVPAYRGGGGGGWFAAASLLLLLALLLPGAASTSYATASFEAGVATRQVIALSKSTLEAAIRDPANAFWFLKFYAPWYA